MFFTIYQTKPGTELPRPRGTCEARHTGPLLIPTSQPSAAPQEDFLILPGYTTPESIKCWIKSQDKNQSDLDLQHKNKSLKMFSPPVMEIRFNCPPPSSSYSLSSRRHPN